MSSSPRLPDATDYLKGELTRPPTETWSVSYPTGNTIRKLTREEVIAKYSPVPDPLWTPEVEARFFAGLPAAAHREAISMDDEKIMLVREFGTVTLKARRMSSDYVTTLGTILGVFADADRVGREFTCSRRDTKLGTCKTIRTIQTQMLAAELLVKVKRTQGHGFVGEVFVYSPRPIYRHRLASAAYREWVYRSSEGECQYLAPPSNLSPADVPFCFLKGPLREEHQMITT